MFARRFRDSNRLNKSRRNRSRKLESLEDRQLMAVDFLEGHYVDSPATVAELPSLSHELVEGLTAPGGEARHPMDMEPMSDADARIVTPSDPNNYILQPGNGWDGVAFLDIQRADLGGTTCTGALLPTGQHILTAAHCVADDFGQIQVTSATVNFDLPSGRVPVSVSTVYSHNSYRPFEEADIAILELNTQAPQGAERYDIYRGSDEFNKVFTKAGYGRTGLGSTGSTNFDGFKRWGQNVYETGGETLNSLNNGNIRAGAQLVYDFDSGWSQNDALGFYFGINDTGLTQNNEANAAQGDSGGPTFVEGLIAGVTSYGFTTGFGGTDWDGQINSSWGEFSADTRVSFYADWIDAITGNGGGSQTGEIHGVTFNDLDGDGTRDNGEPGMGGWTVYLDANNNGQFDGGETSTQTDAAGNYAFTDLPAGTYTVREVAQNGWTQTSPTTDTNPPPSNSQFSIDVVFPDNSLTAGQRAIFTDAANRWSEVIIGDLPDVGSIDDLEIQATAVSIDGIGNILGQAGPDSFRQGSLLPYRGGMEFDTADLAQMEADGTLYSVILHEMGHVIGVGTLWNAFGYVSGSGTNDPRFTGTNATNAYRQIFGTNETSVPAANTGSQGTREAHWRESTLDNEIMTGYVNLGSNPVSAITIGSLQDLGYQVDYNAADPYSPPAFARSDARRIDGHMLHKEIDFENATITPTNEDKPAGPQQRIVGGTTSTNGAWPSTVAVQLFNSPWCGGSLIDDEWVLTAAHCVDGRSAGDFTVVAGTNTPTQNGQQHGVAEIVMHPSYNSNTFDSDIALLRLSTPSSQPTVDYVDPSQGSLFAPGVSATITGWGALSEGGGSPTQLQEVTVPIIDSAVANGPNSYDGEITSNMLTAGTMQGGQDSCQGDSGGPLYVADGQGGYTQAGIVSWGYGCARPNLPGVYTRVANFSNWIDSQIGNNNGGGGGNASGTGWSVDLAAGEVVNDVDFGQHQDQAPTTPSLSISDVSLTEGNSGSKSFNFNVSLSEAASQNVTVTVNTQNGSATAGSDYQALNSQTITFSPGQTQQTVSVQVFGDMAVENDETFTVRLSNPQNATLADATGTGTIRNDDNSNPNPTGPFQTVTGPTEVVSPAGSTLTVPVTYSVSDDDNTLSGLGLRMHFDSSDVTFNGLRNRFNDSFIQQSVQNDTSNFDNDPSTDQFVLVSWADLSGAAWPGTQLPLKLFDADFTFNGALTDGSQSVINFSSSSTASTHDFDSSSVTLTVGQNFSLDIDENGAADALTDGVLAVRHLFGFSGNSLTDGAIDAAGNRTSPAEIASYLTQNVDMLDVDANGTADALTDGVLIVRYLFGFNGNSLTDGALAQDATRTDPTEIGNYLSGLLPAGANALLSRNATPRNSQQLITTSPGSLTVAPGGNVEFDVDYDTSTGDATLVGLGLRVHYDSSALTFDEFADSLAQDRIQIGNPTADNNDFDNDPATDQFVLISWANFSGTWPGQLPATLLTAAFTANVNFTGTTNVNFSASSTASGYTLAQDPIEITVEDNNPQPTGDQVDIRLVPVAQPTTDDSTALPSAIDNAVVGTNYFVEVWVQDLSAGSNGITGGEVDIHYNTTLADGVSITNDDFDVAQFASGTINDSAGLIDNLGGGSLDLGMGANSTWARLGYFEVSVTADGEITYSLSEGEKAMAIAGQGNIDWNDVNLSATATVSHIQSGVRFDVTVSEDRTNAGSDGEVQSLPQSETVVHEWQSYWVEVWVSTPDSTDAGVTRASLDLDYDTTNATAVAIEYNPLYTLNRTGTIDDTAGRITNLGAGTSRTDLGDTSRVLLARVQFVPNASDDVAIDLNNLGGSAGSLGLAMSGANATLSGTGSVPADSGSVADTQIAAVPFDIDDNGTIDFGDLSFFTPEFGQNVAANDQHSRWADFDGSGRVDVGDFSLFAPNFGLGRGDQISLPANFPVQRNAANDVVAEIVFTRTPSASSDGELPDSITSVETGDRYFVEVWVQDRSGNGGLAGGYVDLDYTGTLGEASAADHGGFSMFSSADLSSDPIDDLGGVTLEQNLGTAPGWTRLASVEFTAWGAGDADFALEPGKLELARMGAGNIDWSNVQLGSRSLEILSGWQNRDNPADVDRNGSVTLGDALEVVSELRRNGDRQLRTSRIANDSMVDVNGDGRVNLSDALEVVSELRNQLRAPITESVSRQAEGEATTSGNPDFEATHVEALREAADIAVQMTDAAFATAAGEVDDADTTDFDDLLDAIAIDMAG